jgi:L-fuconolactonase
MTRYWNRRQFVGAVGGIALAATAGRAQVARAAEAGKDYPIIDTHQHLWDLDKFRLPWLEGAPDVLRRSYVTSDYRAATKDLKVDAVYMEVDVAPDQHGAEVEYVSELCRSGTAPTKAAVVGGRPGGDRFPRYVQRLRENKFVKGVRQVLHGESTPAGYCLQPAFVRGIRLLGEAGRSFDLCMRPGELADGLRLAEMCGETRFVVDHCGNADPKAFRSSDEKPAHDPEQWKRDIDALARRDNVICKISGIVARAPAGWKSDDLAPIVNHCLDAFGSQRVVFGGDWPVCLLGAPLADWVSALREIVSSRPADEQRRLWHDNAVAFYGLA